MKKKIFIGLFIAAVIGLLTFAGIALKGNDSEYQPQQNIQAPIEIPETGIVKITELTDNEKPIVALFYVDWCGYCRRFMPEFGKLSKKYGDKFSFVVVNCDDVENSEYLKEYAVNGFPTLYLMDRKLEHDFTLNITSLEDLSLLKKELDKYLKFRDKVINNKFNF